MNKISVIIPTWNRAKTIKVAISSVLNQTLPPYEILICDDGSEDNTFSVVESFKDDRIKYINCGRNGRPAIPRNIGIRESKGDWLAFLDSDDEWSPDKLASQMNRLSQSGNKACSTNADRIIPGKGSVGNLLDYRNDSITFRDIVKCNNVICSSMLISRSLIDVVGSFPEGKEFKAIEDYALWLKIATLTDIDYIDQPLVLYTDDAVTSIRGEVNDSQYKQKMRLLNYTYVNINNKKLYKYINLEKCRAFMYMIEGKFIRAIRRK